jgi:hypothetical protein
MLKYDFLTIISGFPGRKHDSLLVLVHLYSLIVIMLNIDKVDKLCSIEVLMILQAFEKQLVVILKLLRYLHLIVIKLSLDLKSVKRYLHQRLLVRQHFPFKFRLGFF